MVIKETNATYHLDRWDEVLNLPDHSNAVVHSNRVTRQRLTDSAEERRRRDINIYVENIRPKKDQGPTEFCTLKFIAELIEGFEGVGICYDLAHHALSGGTMDEVREYGHLIKHAHLTDTIMPHDRHMPLHRGELDIDGFMRALGDIDFMGNIKIERWPGIRPDWGMRS